MTTIDRPERSQPSAQVEHRVERYTQDADFAWITASLVKQRDDVLDSWLDVASQQSFHNGRQEHAVAAHIPDIFDALVELLRTTSPLWVDPYTHMDNVAVLTKPELHTRMRAEQGLRPTDAVVELLLLRQEIWRALRSAMPDGASASDVIAAEILLNNALDGAISQALTALSDRMEQLSEDFLATAMHEIWQPLTTIIGAAQLVERLLSKPIPDVERALAANNRLHGSARRMTSLLKSFSDASRLTLGSLRLRTVKSDLSAIVLKSSVELGPEIAERVALRASPGLDTIGWWDPDQMEQVFVNLLSNAAKYSPAGSPIEIGLGGTEKVIEASVRDYGIGIAAEDLRNLFGRYMRAGNAIEQGVEGLGLGLYLCRGIVEAHGGYISATSPGPGQGTVMLVVLPRRNLGT